MVFRERMSATMVETPAPSSTVLVWKPQSRATNTVAGNMVTTC
jgi:hypothetical protein